MLLRSPISNPRAPVTPVPSWRWTGNLTHEHAAKYPRRLDKGSRVPVNGFRQLMPSGRPGGIPYFPAPLDMGLEQVPISLSSPGLAARQRQAMKQEVWALTATLRRDVKVSEGLSPLSVARLPRNLNRGWIGRSAQPVQRGLQALHMQVPSDKVQKFAVERIGVEYRRPQIMEDVGPVSIKPTPQQIRNIVADPQGTRWGNQGKSKPMRALGKSLGKLRAEVEHRQAGPSTAPPSAGPSPVTRGIYGGWGRPVMGRMTGGAVSPIRSSASGWTNVLGQRLAAPSPVPTSPNPATPKSGWLQILSGR